MLTNIVRFPNAPFKTNPSYEALLDRVVVAINRALVASDYRVGWGYYWNDDCEEDEYGYDDHLEWELLKHGEPVTRFPRVRVLIEHLHDQRALDIAAVEQEIDLLKKQFDAATEPKDQARGRIE